MLQPPPFELVHRTFGEVVADAANIQPISDTFDFVLEACALLAHIHLDERVKQRHFNIRLEQYLGKPIHRVRLTSGMRATDGSIVDKRDMHMAEVTSPCRKSTWLAHVTSRHFVLVRMRVVLSYTSLQVWFCVWADCGHFSTSVGSVLTLSHCMLHRKAFIRHCAVTPVSLADVCRGLCNAHCSVTKVSAMTC